MSRISDFKELLADVQLEDNSSLKNKKRDYLYKKITAPFNGKGKVTLDFALPSEKVPGGTQLIAVKWPQFKKSNTPDKSNDTMKNQYLSQQVKLLSLGQAVDFNVKRHKGNLKTWEDKISWIWDNVKKKF